MTNPAPDVLRLVPEKLDNTWVLEQAKSLSSDKSEDAVKALAWNLVVHHRRMIEKCPVAPAVQPAAGREEIARIIRERAQIGGTDWHRNAGGADINADELADLIAAISTPAQASGEIHGEVTDEWAERFCEAVNWSPDGQECKTVEGEFRCVSFRDLAKGYILSAIATNPHGAHPPAQTGGEVQTLRVLLDNLVIAQSLSRELRQLATDEARLYLYDLRRDALQPGGER